MQNPFLVLKENGYNMDSTKPVVESDNSINKLESLGFTYNDKTKTYTKVDEDGWSIKYKLSSNVLTREKFVGGLKYSFKYKVNKKTIIYKIFDDNNILILNYRYFTEDNSSKCLIGNCKNSQKEIEYILSIYNEIMNIL